MIGEFVAGCDAGSNVQTNANAYLVNAYNEIVHLEKCKEKVRSADTIFAHKTNRICSFFESVDPCMIRNLDMSYSLYFFV